jgi:hypothetical protein
LFLTNLARHRAGLFYCPSSRTGRLSGREEPSGIVNPYDGQSRPLHVGERAKERVINWNAIRKLRMMCALAENLHNYVSEDGWLCITGFSRQKTGT